MYKEFKIMFHVMILVVAWGAFVSAAPMKVTVQSIKGTVQVNSGSGWKPIKNGDKLPAGAEVKTGANASCILKWENGNAVKVGPLSTLSVDASKIASGAEKSRVNIKEGKVHAHVNKLSAADSSFEIRTPTAVAGVRGTDILTEVREGNADFAVVDGNLQLTVGDETFVLNDGFLVSVDPSGAFSEPIAIPADMLEDIRQEFSQLMEETEDGEPSEGESDGGGDEDDDAGNFDDVLDAIDTALDNQTLNETITTSEEPIDTGTVEIIINTE